MPKQPSSPRCAKAIEIEHAVQKKFPPIDAMDRIASRKVRDAMAIVSAKAMSAAFTDHVDVVMIVRPRGFISCGRPLVIYSNENTDPSDDRLPQDLTSTETDARKQDIREFVNGALDTGDIHAATYRAYTHLNLASKTYRDRFKATTSHTCIVPSCSTTTATNSAHHIHPQFYAPRFLSDTSVPASPPPVHVSQLPQTYDGVAASPRLDTLSLAHNTADQCKAAIDSIQDQLAHVIEAITTGPVFNISM